MNSNLLASHMIALVGVVDPDLNTAGTHRSGWVAVVDHLQFLAIVMAGTIGNAGTVDVKLEQATDDSGADAKDVVGKAITQMAQAGTNASDTQALINLRPEELDGDGGYTHFRVVLTVADASSDSAVAVLGVGPSHGPAIQSATVAETIV